MDGAAEVLVHFLHIDELMHEGRTPEGCNRSHVAPLIVSGLPVSNE